MLATAYRDHRDAATDLDPATLAQSLGALRQELRSLAGELHASQRDNAALRQELDRLQAEPRVDQPRACGRPMPQVQRFKRELEDQLERLRRVSAARAARVEEPSPEPPRASGTGDAAWLRRMVVYMMMAELV